MAGGSRGQTVSATARGEPLVAMSGFGRPSSERATEVVILLGQADLVRGPRRPGHALVAGRTTRRPDGRQLLGRRLVLDDDRDRPEPIAEAGGQPLEGVDHERLRDRRSSGSKAHESCAVDGVRHRADDRPLVIPEAITSRRQCLLTVAFARPRSDDDRAVDSSAGSRRRLDPEALAAGSVATVGHRARTKVTRRDARRRRSA